MSSVSLSLVPTAHRETLKDQVSRSQLFVDSAQTLPTGIIHGDLFCDNALFHQGKLAGIIDFYNACNGCLLFDLAVTINDWCSDPTGRLQADKTEALMSGYHQHRPLIADESTVGRLP